MKATRGKRITSEITKTLSTSIIRNNHVHTAKSYHCSFAWHCLHITEISRPFSVAHFPQVGLLNALQIVTVALVHPVYVHFCLFLGPCDCCSFLLLTVLSSVFRRTYCALSSSIS